ncbi:cytochrome P450, family 77, subfamily A, polypeptide 4 [Actinidia rufa]|uniref:Cytochrome P450, family 77, subfamily A, polypeptide 4 n=1 Tax=Actinidia rufa TaxID=165716 RepID=A0A7J0GUW1_9ERIC|nr:cytochrome P450, family 77, subfamily A, polypeptide 4 [Actinidia rufa]
MGNRTMIIISSAELAHEALIEKGQIFATRPRESPTRNIFSCDKFTVNAALYGPVWRSLRKNMVQGMLSSTRLKQFSCVRNVSMDKMIVRIRSESEANDGAVWVLRSARGGQKSAPTNAEIVTLVSELLNGGTDTTATGIEWAIARMIENPEMQYRLYNEIKSTVGRDRSVDERDCEKMVYLNAFVKELLRKHRPTYFSLAHAVTEPTKLGGREDADMMGMNGVKMIPFGMGQRICPGLGMATTHINLMIARLVQAFEWSVYPENNKVDFSENTEFTVLMKNTLRAKVKPRV